MPAYPVERIFLQWGNEPFTVKSLARSGLASRHWGSLWFFALLFCVLSR
jgi:hypothetical protein